ncbi:uncharacterized protein LOC109831229 [Asparagus officinalis]|uniref:uncharacterized protein LOC109831229 n=1 Tax=Asparagus officinalis TaxID=4686 RepID=UPI00098E20D3|nr:uncharacterized protein LOC109831229 [Asparagus officinalis]
MARYAGFQSKWPLVGWGDFNTILNSEEKLGGAQVTEADTTDFQNFINLSHLAHLKATGCFYSWSNKQEAETRIWSILDRILVNEDWIQKYTSSQVDFLMPSCSDHSPALITICEDKFEGKRPFRFFNMWTKHPDFIPAVKSVWEQNIRGYCMYRFHKKLKDLKPILKELNRKHFMNISEQVKRAKDELADIQKQISDDLLNQRLILKEKECISKYTRLLNCENQRLILKEKEWFCQYTQRGVLESLTLLIFLKNLLLTTRSYWVLLQMSQNLIAYYKKLLGTSTNVSEPDMNVIANGPVLTGYFYKCLRT